jgi:hypothetical protein
MADRSNGYIVSNLVLAPSATAGVTALPGQFAVGVQVIGGTCAIVNQGGSFGNGFIIPSGVLGINTTSNFYLAASGSTASLQFLTTIQGTSLLVT